MFYNNYTSKNSALSLNLIIFAPKLSSGGLSLLNAVLSELSCQEELYRTVTLVTSHKNILPNKNIKIIFGRNRVECERKIFYLYSDQTIVLNFVNIPILRYVFKKEFNEIIFFHNFLLCSNDLNTLNFSGFVKMVFFKTICMMIGRQRKFIVQSKNVEKKLSKFIPQKNIEVCKFYHEVNQVNRPITRKDLRFLYISSNHKHKNNNRLIEAWKRVNCKNAQLTLVIPSGMQLSERYSKVENLTIVTDYVANDKILNMLKNSDFLIYPSLAESFGIPLIEASGLAIPILASHRDFVWEVCTPKDTFNPLDIKSIMACIIRSAHQSDSKNFQSVNDFLLTVSSMADT